MKRALLNSRLFLLPILTKRSLSECNSLVN
jgi:hypothetical protein